MKTMTDDMKTTSDQTVAIKDSRLDKLPSKDVELLRSYGHLSDDQEFQGLESSAQRIEYILQKVRPFEQFRKDVQQKVSQYREQHMKCRIRSENFLRSGVKSYGKDDYKSANEWLKKAILSAPFPTELDSYGNALGLSFAEKFAVDFKTKNYLSALFAANCSLQFLDSLEILLKRIYCLILLNRYEESLEMYHQLIDRMENDPKLNKGRKSAKDFEYIPEWILTRSSKNNGPGIFITRTSDIIDYIPEGQFWIHPTCGLESDVRRGRHYVAKQFVPKGTALMIEQPFSKVLVDRSNRCGNCHKSLIYELWPCVGCDELAFCSKKCFVEVYDKYHKYECTFLGYFDWLGAPYAHTFRIISRIGVQRVLELEHKRSDTDFKEYIARNQSEEVLDYEMMYRAVNSKADNISRIDKLSKLLLSIKSMEIALMLINGREIDIKSFVVLADICFHMCHKTTNSFVQSVFQAKDPKRLVVANCINIVGSLFNHSCDPNSKWSYSSGRLVVTSDRDIEIGDEINISYGPTIKNQAFVQRQIKLRTGYFFSCGCDGCINDTYSQLTLSCRQCSGPVILNLPLPERVADKKAYCLQCGEDYKNLEKAKNRFKKLKAKVEKTIANLDNEHDSDVSLVSAEWSLKDLMKIACKRSAPLLEYVNQLLPHLMNYGKLEEALRFGQFISKALNLDALIENPKFGTVGYEYLIEMTDCYHQYMKSKSVLDTNHWKQCFAFYSRLLRVLHKQKAWIEREESKTEYKTAKILLCALLSVIRMKKMELKELVELCKQSKRCESQSSEVARTSASPSLLKLN